MSNTEFPFFHPQTLGDLQSIIDRRMTESIHLEFKRSEALISEKSIKEISKDVSSFANSDGGVIVYGMIEEDHRPTKLDAGVDHGKWSKERVEDVIQSNVAPRIDGLLISQIQMCGDRSIYVIAIPRSDRGPHQDRHTFRYYKRHNFKSSPMEDYEIADVRNRYRHLPPLISVRVDVAKGMLLEVVVENVGNDAASDITFSIDPPLFWKHGEPLAFKDGVRSLFARKKLRFAYGSAPEVLGGASNYVLDFVVQASYFHHGAQKRINDRFEIDLNSLIGTLQEQSDLQVQAEKIEKSIGKLSAEMERIKNHLEKLSCLADPTGLALSVTTLRNLARLLGVPSQMEKIDPCACSWQTFQEVLLVDARTAIRLVAFFRKHDSEKALVDIEGMTPDVLARLERHFVMAPPSSSA